MQININFFPGNIEEIKNKKWNTIQGEIGRKENGKKK